MVKGKVVTKGLASGAKAAAKTKVGRAAGLVTAAEVIEEASDNAAVQAGIGAIEGAALGAAFGPAGAIGGAIAGGLIGFILADGERITPCDMIAIPAYQYSALLNGNEPTFQIFIKEGELIAPVLPTDTQRSMAALEVAQAVIEAPKKKLSKWNRYTKQKKNQIRYKSGKKKGQLNFSAMGKEYRRSN